MPKKPEELTPQKCAEMLEADEAGQVYRFSTKQLRAAARYLRRLELQAHNEYDRQYSVTYVLKPEGDGDAK